MKKNEVMMKSVIERKVFGAVMKNCLHTQEYFYGEAHFQH